MDKKSLYTVLGVLILAVLVAVFELGPRTEVDLSVSDAKNNQIVRNNATVSELTKKLLTVAHDLRKATPEQHDALLAQLVTLAKSRQTQMLMIGQNDPDAVVKNTIPASVKKQLPEEVRDLIEDSAELSGELGVYIGENDAETVIYDYTLTSSGKTTKLNMGGYRKDLVTGQKVKVKGTLVTGEMNVGTDSTSVQVTSQVAGEPTTNRRVAAILFNYTSNLAQPYTASAVREGLFGTGSSVNNFYLENSFGKMGITGDVFDYVTVNTTPTTCDYRGISSMADSVAASQRGFVRSNYDNILYFFPELPGCSGFWWGSIGGYPANLS